MPASSPPITAERVVTGRRPSTSNIANATAAYGASLQTTDAMRTRPWLAPSANAPARATAGRTRRRRRRPISVAPVAIDMAPITVAHTKLRPPGDNNSG